MVVGVAGVRGVNVDVLANTVIIRCKDAKGHEAATIRYRLTVAPNALDHNYRSQWTALHVQVRRKDKGYETWNCGLRRTTHNKHSRILCPNNIPFNFCMDGGSNRLLSDSEISKYPLVCSPKKKFFSFFLSFAICWLVSSLSFTFILVSNFLWIVPVSINSWIYSVFSKPVDASEYPQTTTTTITTTKIWIKTL